MTAGIKAGISPVKAIEQERIEQEERLRATETAQQNTFTVLTEMFYERQIAAGVWKNEHYRQQWLREMKRLVFPGMAKPNKHGSWAMSDMTLTKLLREHLEGFHSDRPDKGPTVHGFRASFKNWATEHGYDDLQSEIQLAHDVGNDVYQSYMRSAMIEKRRQMMQAWADYLFSAVAA